jgi:putative transposase
MTLEPASYPRHRFPAEIISHAVWLYHVFSLSLRDVELILAERGVIVTRESIRHWCRKFGADFARLLRRRRPRPGDTWHLDEVFIRLRTAWCWTSWCRSGGMAASPPDRCRLPARACEGVPDLAAGDVRAVVRRIIFKNRPDTGCVPAPVKLPMPDEALCSGPVAERFFGNVAKIVARL